MPANSLFLGVTTSPAREFIAKCLLAQNKKILMPCVGRFAAVEAILGMNPKAKVFASDIGLFSSIIGYLADSQKGSLAELKIEVSAELPAQPETGAGPEYDLAAHAMLALRYGQITSKHLKGMNERAEIIRHWARYHHQMVRKIEDLVGSLAGMRYDIRDLWDVVAEAGKATMFVNVPVYKNGYERMFNTGTVKWNAPPSAQFDYKSFPNLLDKIQASGCLALVYATKTVKDLPRGWLVVFAHVANAFRTDYIIANYDPNDRLAVQRIPQPTIKHYPVYCDEEITEKSVVTMIRSDTPTCLYYRDLFVHKLGSTAAQNYFLLLMDGRVMTAFGLDMQHLRRFDTDYIHEWFGISKSSKRYKFLGKLFMLLLTSKDTKKFFESVFHFGVREPRGIQTTSITTHPEGKTDRSVMKAVHREQLKDGRWKLMYRTDFHDNTWPDVLRMWLAKWGGKARV